MSSLERFIGSYVHDGRIGVLVEIGVESDFTMRLEQVQEFMRDVALHIAAESPTDVADLLRQSFVKDRSQTVGERMSVLSQDIREIVRVTRFVRWDTEWNLPTQDLPPHDPAAAMPLKVVK